MESLVFTYTDHSGHPPFSHPHLLNIRVKYSRNGDEPIINTVLRGRSLLTQEMERMEAWLTQNDVNYRMKRYSGLSAELFFRTLAEAMEFKLVHA